MYVMGIAYIADTHGVTFRSAIWI